MLSFDRPPVYITHTLCTLIFKYMLSQDSMIDIEILLPSKTWDVLTADVKISMHSSVTLFLFLFFL